MLFGEVIFNALTKFDPMNEYPKSIPAINATVVVIVADNLI
jgi:hypothetical protein